MFDDRRSIKARAVLEPLLWWFVAGCVGELIAVIAFFFVIGGRQAGYDFGRDFFVLLSGAHERWEIFMVLFRNLAPLPVLLRLFHRDSMRIGDRHAEKQPLFLWPLTGIGFCLFMNLLLFMLFGGEAAADGGLKAESGSRQFIWLLLTELAAAPVTEELMCRGLIYRRVRTYSGVLFASFLSALIFAVLHWDLQASLYVFFLSFLLCDVYETTRRVWWCAAVHAAANLVSVLILYIPALSAAASAHPAVFCIAGGVLLFGTRLMISRFTGDKTKLKE